MFKLNLGWKSDTDTQIQTPTIAAMEQRLFLTQDDILSDKIGSSIGVYSGVCEYTANTGTNTEYTEYTRYLVDLLTCSGRIPAV